MTLVEEMQKANINVEPYRRAPFGRSIFAASIIPKTPEGTIKLYAPGEIENLDTSKRFRQASFTLTEPKREITRQVQWLSVTAPKTNREAINMFRNLVTVPANIRFEVETTSKNGEFYSGYRFNNFARVTAHIPGTVNNFLMGFDTKYHFISALPVAPKSVEHAHQILRPRQLPSGTVREGEWFFAPCEEYVCNLLEKRVVERPRTIGFRRLEASSSHYALQATSWRGNLYVSGYVLDSRVGHHDPLWLPNWHRVVRNKEINMVRSSVASRRTWD